MEPTLSEDEVDALFEIFYTPFRTLRTRHSENGIATLRSCKDNPIIKI